MTSRHLYAVGNLGKSRILLLLDQADALRRADRRSEDLAGKILGLFFLQPSTRTRLGFHAAMVRLGGSAIELTSTKLQEGMTEAESLLDTIRSVSAYCDVIVLRHPDAQAVEEAMALTSTPIINGGAGIEHHPTQSLIDLFAIRRHLGRLENLRVGVVGGLRTSRAALSFLQALAFMSPREVRLIAPDGSQIPRDLVLALSPTEISETDDVTLEGLDVVYMAGFPEESGGTRSEEAMRRQFSLTLERASKLQHGAIVLSPLPRVDEIDRRIDRLSCAKYFNQSREGLFIRMAVLLDRLSQLSESQLPEWTRSLMR